jgi:colanic acid biosynthesis glycosyl transferase WcaI
MYGLYFSPDLIGIGKYQGEMADWLALRGHDVRVVAAPPYYPDWRIAPGYSGRRYSFEGGSTNGDGAREGERKGRVIVYRCPVWVPLKPTGLRRLLHYMSFSISSLPILLSQVIWRPDIVFVVQPTLICSPQAWILSRICSARSWMHIQDFEVDAAFEMKLLSNKYLRALAYFLEYQFTKRFETVSTISTKMLGRLANKGVADGVLFPNWVDTDAIFPLNRASRMRSELGIGDNEIVALYSGNIGVKQGLQVVVEAARLVESNVSIQFIICGEGPEKRTLEGLALGIENVKFIPLQPESGLNELLNLADIHLLPQVADAADLVMPSKLTGMLASGRPTVATANVGTEVAKVVNGRGIVIRPGDAIALADAIIYLAERPDIREALGSEARAFAVNNLSRNAILEKFEKEMLIPKSQ